MRHLIAKSLQRAKMSVRRAILWKSLTSAYFAGIEIEQACLDAYHCDAKTERQVKHIRNILFGRLNNADM